LFYPVNRFLRLHKTTVQRNRKNNRSARATDRGKAGTSGLFNFARDSYLERTSRPVYAIGFLLPFIVFYEFGTILINTDILDQSQIRVVAFVWLRDLLESVGFGGKFAWAAPPLVVVAILAGLQLASRKRWSFNSRDILPMGVECAALAVPLIVLSLFLSSPAAPQGDIARAGGEALGVQNASVEASCGGVTVLLSRAEPGAAIPTRRLLLTNIVTGIGAGIYEELVFRLILICLLMMLFQDVLRLSHKSSIILSVLVSAALFSAHHHIVFLDGELGRVTDFNWTKFCFRAIAGVYFAILFAVRGFGITAGTHAFYDIIATIVNAAFFEQ
jgi:hypothetical protein